MTRTIKIKKVHGKYYQPFKHSYMRVVKASHVFKALNSIVREFLLTGDTPKVTPYEFELIMQDIVKCWCKFNAYGQMYKAEYERSMVSIMSFEMMHKLYFRYGFSVDKHNNRYRYDDQLRSIVESFFNDNKDYFIDMKETYDFTQGLTNE